MTAAELDELADDDDPICLFVMHWSDGSSSTCAAPAQWEATAGCVHEHVGTRPICDHHAEFIRSGGGIGCGYCKPDHECKLLTARIEPIR